MDNLYTSSNEISFKEIIKYCCLVLATFIILNYLQYKNIINIENSSIIDSELQALSVVFIMSYVINRKLSKSIIDEMNVREVTLSAFYVPILAGIGVRVFIDFLQILPKFFGGNIIEIAKGQLDTSSFYPIEDIILSSILAPFVEELIFRVVFFTSIAFLIGFIDVKFKTKYSSKVYNLRNVNSWFLIILNGALFSLWHEPDITNFHLYFIGGIVNALIYVKYGFYSSWISHGVFNSFTQNLFL